MDIFAIGVTVGALCVAAVLLYAVPKTFSKSSKIQNQRESNQTVVEKQVENIPEVKNEPVSQPQITGQAIYETVQPQTAIQNVASPVSPAVMSFGSNVGQQENKPKRRASYNRNRSRATHNRKHKQE